jgi:hypothetical protein
MKGADVVGMFSSFRADTNLGGWRPPVDARGYSLLATVVASLLNCSAVQIGWIDPLTIIYRTALRFIPWF